MLSSNACVVSALIEKRSSTFPYPSNWASLVRKDAPKGHRPSRRVRASKTTPVRGKKSAGGRDDAATSDQKQVRGNRFLKAVFARARGVVSMEEGFPGKKVRPFLVVMRNFRGGKGRNGEIFVQFSDAFFVVVGVRG